MPQFLYVIQNSAKSPIIIIYNSDLRRNTVVTPNCWHKAIVDLGFCHISVQVQLKPRNRLSHLFVLFIQIGQLQAAQAKRPLHLHNTANKNDRSELGRTSQKWNLSLIRVIGGRFILLSTNQHRANHVSAEKVCKTLGWTDKMFWWQLEVQNVRCFLRRFLSWVIQMMLSDSP